MKKPGRHYLSQTIGCCAAMLFIVTAASFSQETVSLDAKSRAEIVNRISELLRDNYVYPEIGVKMGDHIRKKLKDGAYNKISDINGFIGQLTKDLLEVCKDRHLQLEIDPQRAAALNENAPPDMKKLEKRRRLAIEEERRRNFGFEKFERLPGNVAYLDLRYFADTDYAGKTAATAMNLLSNADAVIIDLRQNGGGHGEMVQLLSSYFFSPEPVHLGTTYFRPSDKTIQTWTLPFVPGERMNNVDLYILTSRRTFSAAEAFAFNLKNLKRAVIIGETTRGGAHPVDYKAVNKNIVLKIPIARSVNPVNQTAWEGTGVKPDIEIKQEEALHTAHITALKNLAKKPRDEYYEYYINDIGYVLLEMKEMKDAIEVFQYNVELHPKWAFGYDSLGEAHEKNGDKELAIKNCEKALELDPSIDTSIAALKRLRGK